MLIDEHLRRMAETFPEETAYTVVDVGALTFAEWDGHGECHGPRPGGGGTQAG